MAVAALEEWCGQSRSAAMGKPHRRDGLRHCLCPRDITAGRAADCLLRTKQCLAGHFCSVSDPSIQPCLRLVFPDVAEQEQLLLLLSLALVAHDAAPIIRAGLCSLCVAARGGPVAVIQRADGVQATDEHVSATKPCLKKPASCSSTIALQMREPTSSGAFSAMLQPSTAGALHGVGAHYDAGGACRCAPAVEPSFASATMGNGKHSAPTEPNDKLSPPPSPTTSSGHSS